MPDQPSSALHAERERYRVLVEQIGVGLYRTDAAHRLEHVNERYLAMLGCTAADVAGWGWLERVHPDDRDRVETGARAAGQRHAGWADEYRVRTGLRVRCTAQPLRGATGAFAGYWAPAST